MKIKCGRREFEVSKKDRIMFNGAVYILITQTYHVNWNDVHPTVSKGLVKRLLKEGKLRLSKERYVISNCRGDATYDLYEFVEEEL